ncbi:MAG: hypothetical protein J5645_07735 [Lachnospiraceae bacterium]|nr:hypothetical protein [Lachnospiraceae bacterium]
MSFWDKYFSGHLVPGEYDHLRCHGQTFLHGRVQCRVLSTTGLFHAFETEEASKAPFLTCHELYVCGEFNVPRAVCNEALFYPNSSFRGGLHASRTITIQRDFTGRGAMRAPEIKLTGKVQFSGSVSCRRLTAKGFIVLGNLVANGVRIQFENISSCRSVEAVNILIQPVNRSLIGKALLASWDSSYTEFRTSGDIRGKFIDIEHVSAANVIGDDINIGPGCTIECVRYKNHLYIDNSAWVGWYAPIDGPATESNSGTYDPRSTGINVGSGAAFLVTNDTYVPDLSENEPEPEVPAPVEPDDSDEYRGPYLDGPLPPSPVPEDPSAPAVHMDAFADASIVKDATDPALFAGDDDEPIEDDADKLASLGPTYQPRVENTVDDEANGSDDNGSNDGPKGPVAP